MRSLSCAARARSTSFAIAQLASTMMMSPDVDSFRSVDASTLLHVVPISPSTSANLRFLRDRDARGRDRRRARERRRDVMAIAEIRWHLFQAKTG